MRKIKISMNKFLDEIVELVFILMMTSVCNNTPLPVNNVILTNLLEWR